MSNSLLKKGSYKPIDKGFLLEGHTILNEVALVQEKYGKNDTDVFINELRDSMVGYYLGYNLVNLEKHGFDCKLNCDDNIFLEVKSASFNSSIWGATFNDTTIEKAKLFQTDNIFLALAIWKNASDLLFVVYGKNKKLGKFLEKKVSQYLSGEGGVRSTQTVSMSQLIFSYDFDIICINKTKKQVKEILNLKSRSNSLIPNYKFLNLEEYSKKYSIESASIQTFNRPNKDYI